MVRILRPMIEEEKVWRHTSLASSTSLVPSAGSALQRAIFVKLPHLVAFPSYLRSSPTHFHMLTWIPKLVVCWIRMAILHRVEKTLKIICRVSWSHEWIGPMVRCRLRINELFFSKKSKISIYDFGFNELLFEQMFPLFSRHLYSLVPVFEPL